MTIEKINFSYPKGTLQSNFDTEELTALELAAKTAKKVDEVVELANGVEQVAIEATGIVDTMKTAQDQFIVDNSDTRAQLIADNTEYIAGLDAEVQTAVDTKVDALVTDGTIEGILTPLTAAKADKTYVDSELATRDTAIAAKAATTDMTAALALKADADDVAAALAFKADTAYVDSKASAFTDLTDVPQSLTDQGGKIVSVKSDATGLEFISQTTLTGAVDAHIADGNHDELIVPLYNEDPATPKEGQLWLVPQVSHTSPSQPVIAVAVGNTSLTVSIATPSTLYDSATLAGYNIYRGGVLIANTVALPYTDSGLTNGLSYSYQVETVDSMGGVSAISASVSAIPTALYSDDFNDQSTNTSLWGDVKSGGATITEDANGRVVLDSLTTAQAIRYKKSAVNLTVAKVYEFLGKTTVHHTNTNEFPSMIALSRGVPDLVNGFTNTKIHVVVQDRGDGTGALYCIYVNTSGTAMYYDQGGVWSATLGTPYAYTDLTDYKWQLEVDPNSGNPRVRILVKQSNDTLVFATAWVNVSSLQGAGDLYLFTGATHSTLGKAKIEMDYYNEI